jgi:hypothetical protein
VFATGEVEVAADPQTVWAVMADIGRWLGLGLWKVPAPRFRITCLPRWNGRRHR